AAADWALAPAPAVVDFERHLPAVLPLDGEGEVVWRVGNPTSRRLVVSIADELAPSLSPTTRRVRLVVAPGGRTSAVAQLRPQRRGRFTPTEVVVRIEGPLRLPARHGPR